MANIAGPRINGIVRTQGTWLVIDWTAMATGYTGVRAMVRRLNSEGTPVGGWQQANNAVGPPSPWTLTSIGGSPFTTDRYQVQFFATHSSGQPVNPSNIFTAPGWEVDKPTLTAVERINPTQAHISFADATVGGAGAGTIYVDRRAQPTGTWERVTSFRPSAASGQYTVQLPSGSTGYDIRIFAGEYGVSSDMSQVRSVNPWSTPVPSLDSAVRTLAGVTIGFSDSGTSGERVIEVQHRIDGNAGWAGTTTTFAPTAASGTRPIPLPSATRAYDIRIRQRQFGVWSGWSSSRSVDSWWLRPSAPQDFVLTRNASLGTVGGAWQHGGSTAQTARTGYRVYRAVGDEPFPTTPWRTLGANERAFTDTTTDRALTYRYAIEAYNAAGASSSRPAQSTDAVLLAPNAATGLSVTHLGGNRYRVTWSISATVSRPVTSQEILGRVPGSTRTATLATVGGGTTTTILDLPANRIYEVAALTRNGVGPAESTSNWAGPVVSIPAVPAWISAAWVDPSQILTTFPAVTTVADVLDIEFSTELVPDPDDPAHWFPGVAGLPLPRESWPHPTSARTAPHTYRMRSHHVASGQVSAWVYSARLDGQTSPHAPTMLQPRAVDAASTVVLEMVHNPVDGTRQTLGQIRYRVQGATTWVTRSVGTLWLYNLDPGVYTNGQTLEVQGRTAGGSGVYGPWSDSLLVTLRPAPTVTITHPVRDSTGWVDWHGQDVTIRWQSSAQSSARIRLTGPGFPGGYETTVGADIREHTIRGLQDGAAYKIFLDVRDSWQWGAAPVINLDVSYDLPAPPTLTAEVRPDDASVLLQAAPVNSLRTTRVNLDVGLGAWVTRATGQPAPRATRMIAGAPVETLVVAPGQVVQSPPLQDPPAGLYWDNPRALAAADAPTSAAVRYVDSAESVGGGGNDPVAATPTVLIGDALVPTGPWRVAVENLGSAPLYVWAPLTVLAASISDYGRPDFDGDTVDPDGRYVYGWNDDGTSWEAVPDPTGDRPVAQTVRIEIWCSRTGAPGSFRRCGETSTDWSHHHRHPAVGVDLWYVARAYAESGAWAESVPLRVRVDSCDAHVSYGPDHGLQVRAGWEPSYTGTGGRRSVIDRYVGPDGEDRLGVTYGPKMAREVTTTLIIDTRTGDSPLPLWEDAAENKGHVIYRDPAGRVLVGPMQGFTWDDSDEFAQTVSFKVTHVGAPA